MTQINFNDKQNGDFFTADDANELKNVINSNEGVIQKGFISGYIDQDNNIAYNTHIVPQFNERFDIGDAGHKVRNLFLSSCSIWMHDDIKIDAYNGSVRSLTRDKSKLPNYITGALRGTTEGATGFANVNSVEEMSLQNIEDYAKSLDEFVKIADIFPDYYDANYTDSDYSNISILNTDSNSSYQTISTGEDSNFGQPTVAKNYFDINLYENSNFILTDMDHSLNIFRFNLEPGQYESKFYEVNCIITGVNQFSDLILPSFKFNGNIINGSRYYHETLDRNISEQNNSDNMLIKTFLKINSNPGDPAHPSGEMILEHYYFNTGSLSEAPKYLPRSTTLNFGTSPEDDVVQFNFIGDSVGDITSLDSQTPLNEGDDAHYWKMDETETSLTFYKKDDGTTAVNDLVNAEIRNFNGVVIPNEDITITLINGAGTGIVDSFGGSIDLPEYA